MFLNPVHYTALFKEISNKLIESNLDEKRIGRAVYRKASAGKYAHIEIMIYRTLADEYGFRQNQFIWNVSENQIPSVAEYKISVLKVLEFFIEHISALRGETIELTFEIIGGSYHSVDSAPKLYGIATVFALINAFDNAIMKFEQEKVFLK